MAVQEIIAFGLVAVAALYSFAKFIRQFTHGDEPAQCSKCELKKVVTTSRQRGKQP